MKGGLPAGGKANYYKELCCALTVIQIAAAGQTSEKNRISPVKAGAAALFRTGAVGFMSKIVQKMSEKGVRKGLKMLEVTCL